MTNVNAEAHLGFEGAEALAFAIGQSSEVDDIVRAILAAGNNSQAHEEGRREACALASLKAGVAIHAVEKLAAYLVTVPVSTEGMNIDQRETHGSWIATHAGNYFRALPPVAVPPSREAATFGAVGLKLLGVMRGVNVSPHETFVPFSRANIDMAQIVLEKLVALEQTNYLVALPPTGVDAMLHAAEGVIRGDRQLNWADREHFVNAVYSLVVGAFRSDLADTPDHIINHSLRTAKVLHRHYDRIVHAQPSATADLSLLERREVLQTMIERAEPYLAGRKEKADDLPHSDGWSLPSAVHIDPDFLKTLLAAKYKNVENQPEFHHALMRLGAAVIEDRFVIKMYNPETESSIDYVIRARVGEILKEQPPRFALA